ncbi:MAG: glycine betaine/L-proline ABC transporter substrate-binding protein ProX [Elainellaceae cyanobacterium]
MTRNFKTSNTSNRWKGFGITAALTAIIAGISACDGGQEVTTDGTEEGGEVVTEVGTLPGEGKTVTPGYSVLEELFQTEVVNIGLERLGYDIAPGKELEYATLHVDIANGGITYTAAHWEKLHEEFFENSGGDEALERTGTYIPNVLQGYKIDVATAEEYGITSIEQLQDPEIAALFDTDGDGKANLTGCNPGWGCELVIEHQLDEYGLRDTVQHDQGQYFALIADTITRYEQGEPILFYTWTPLWVSGVLQEGEDVTWLEVPYTSLPEAQGEVSEADTTVDDTNLGFAIDEQMVLANQEFISENPEAARFFELAQVPIEDVSAQNQLIQAGEDTPEAIRGHAEAWVEENQETFNTWIEEAVAQ